MIFHFDFKLEIPLLFHRTDVDIFGLNRQQCEIRNGNIKRPVHDKEFAINFVS